MKLHLLDRSNLENTSFKVSHNRKSSFLKIWHYHPELELVLIIKSTGTMFVGNSIEKFQPNDVVLIGKNLPHMWLNDKMYFDKSKSLLAEAISIHFKKDFLGRDFFNIPEMKSISFLFEKSKRGIWFQDLPQVLIKEIKELRKNTGIHKLILFIQILNKLAHHKKIQILAGEGFIQDFKKPNTKIFEEVYEYIFKNFQKTISLQEIAEIANMNPSSFCRYFKKTNRKTFSQYVNEIRVGYACKLLTEGQFNITRICYESGFKNISNFNRQFKKITNRSPTKYLNMFSTQNAKKDDENS